MQASSEEKGEKKKVEDGIRAAKALEEITLKSVCSFCFEISAINALSGKRIKGGEKKIEVVSVGGGVAGGKDRRDVPRKLT